MRMKFRKNGMADIHYYSERLKQKLDHMRTSLSVIVEAPSGYGKTTAVRDHLEASVSQSAAVYWFTAADEAPEAGFRRLCHEIEKIDGHAGKRLLQTGLPGATGIGEACDALRSMECDYETWLVIDNFQYFSASLPSSFLAALLEHGGKELHIIVVTQMLSREVHKAIVGRGFLHITASDLRLDAGDICRYYALAGVEVTGEAARSVVGYTEGWIIAVYLQLKAYQETGAFSDTAIITLMDHLVWERLTEQQQTFLMRLSPFQTFTLQQACALAQWDAIPGYALEALQSPFIHYDRQKQRYELHSILSELLAQKRREHGDAFHHECLLRAGDLCRDTGRDAEALGFYLQAGDYGRTLSLDLSAFYFSAVDGVPFYELALRIAKTCPADLMKERPLSMLRIAYALLTSGMDEEFAALMSRLRPMLGQGDSESSLILGEWMLLSSYQAFPRLDEMTSILEQAESLFDGKHSQVITADAPWCYSIYAPFLIWHTVPGEADREADAFEKYIAIYSRLTGGHGSGADVLFRLELARYRGDMPEAEILAYKAMFVAQSGRQKAIQLAATLHLAEIALEKGDADSYRHAVASLQAAPSAIQNIFALPSALETAQGLMLTELKHDEGVADWLKNGDFSGRQLSSMEKDRISIYFGFLLEQEKYAQLIGAARAMFPHGIQMECYQDVYIILKTAMALFRSGDSAKAAEMVGAAIRMALPDRLFTPLIYHSHFLGKMVIDGIAREFPDQSAKFEMERKRFQSAYAEVFFGLPPDELPGDLTPREREVALLAARGLRNSEIANKLTVSENTVRFHLRAVFQKLDIDRRARLAEKLL